MRVVKYVIDEGGVVKEEQTESTKRKASELVEPVPVIPTKKEPFPSKATNIKNYFGAKSSSSSTGAESSFQPKKR